MAEANQFVFSHREIVELMIKKQNLHSGIWGMWVNFGIKGSNISTGESIRVLL